MKRLVLGTAFGCLIGVADARDLGQWGAGDPQIREWYQALMQPDNPAASCCGEADAYWADSSKSMATNTSPSSPTPDLTRRYIANMSMSEPGL